MCHICGHSEPVPARCPVCGGHLRQIGCGTQRVEEQLQNLLPGVGVLRMDADTVSAVNTHEKLFRRFREERIPILLGTQFWQTVSQLRQRSPSQQALPGARRMPLRAIASASVGWASAGMS